MIDCLWEHYNQAEYINNAPNEKLFHHTFLCVSQSVYHEPINAIYSKKEMKYIHSV